MMKSYTVDTQVNKLQLCAAMWINYISVILKKEASHKIICTSWSKQTQVNYIFKEKYIGGNGVKKMKKYYMKSISHDNYPKWGERVIWKKKLMGDIYHAVSTHSMSDPSGRYMGVCFIFIHLTVYLHFMCFLWVWYCTTRVVRITSETIPSSIILWVI